MAWTYAQLAAAYNALSPVPASLSDACAALNAQTTTLTNQPITWLATKKIARIASTGDWSRIVARSRQVPALPPVTATDVAILAAINAEQSEDADILDPTNTAQWDAFQAGISALEASGDLTSATAAAIVALATVVMPTWQPAVTPGDLQTAGV